MKMDEPQKVVGLFTVLWRKENKEAAKILSVDEEKGRISYELISGTDQGKKFSGKFDSSQTVNVFDEDTKIMAILDN